jgi:predicted enzyme related to lactoylglutathione lyase
MSRPVHFEITADDPERAVRFYEAALGWKINQMGDIDRTQGGIPYWLANTGEGDMGINGAIKERGPAGQTTIITVGVPDLEAALEAVRKAGGKADGAIDDIPNVGRFTYAFDTEGNAFGVLQPLPREK